MIRLLDRNELNNALPLVWKVFCDYEAIGYPEAGKQAFWNAIHSEEYLDVLTAYGAFDNDRLIGIKDNGDSVPVTFSKILYFEAVDRYVFAYTSASVYKVRNTLYELEEMCRTRSFVRISKAQIVNVNAVRKISPDEGRKLRLLLANGETVIVSRGYVGDLKKTIGMKGDA